MTMQAAQRVRKIREAMNLSRPKFADLMGVPPTTLKNYELGYREIGGGFLITLGRVLGGETVLWIMGVATIEQSQLEHHAKRLNAKLAASGVVLRHRREHHERANV